MRKLSLLLVLLVVPAMAFGQSTKLNLVSGPNPGPYVSVLDGSGFAPGSTFILWSVVETTRAIDGLEYRLHVNGDADNGKFNIIDYATGPLSGFEGFLGQPPGSFDGLGAAFQGGFGGQNGSYLTRKDEFGTNVLPSSIAALNTSEVIFDSAALVPAANINGKTVIGYVIQCGPSFTVGNYVFSALGATSQSTATALWTASGQNPSSGAVTEGASFTLTPEPTSALLLLVAVPFLRRRRA